MKLYIQDRGVYGCIIVVANSVEQAKEYMSGEYNYNVNETIEEVEIKEGFVYCNLGDS